MFNEDDVFSVKHEYCPNCVRSIIKKYAKLRKTTDELKPMPDEVEEHVYSILRVSIESLDQFCVCDYCGRLWKDSIRITIPHGKCKRCIKTPEITTAFQHYEKL